MKRFLVFGFLPYEAGGGWADYFGDYDTYEEAIADNPSKSSRDWVRQVVDTETKKDVDWED